MTMKKNDRLELIRQGAAAVRAKIVELEHEHKALTLDTRNQNKNRHVGRDLRRRVAQLKTALVMTKETK